MIFRIGDPVRSLRDERLDGIVIGYGMLQWTDGDDVPVLVYLVQIDERGSSSLGPAVAVLRHDMTAKREGK